MNASNLKYRNRLKRRVMITRQQLYQPAPLQEPLSPADVVPRQVDRNNNDNRGGHVMKQRSINNNTNNNSGVRKEERDNENHDGYVSRHNGSSNINNNRVANHDSHRTSRPPNNNSVNQKGSNEGEAMVNRAREIISQRSQRINSSASSPSSPKASLSRASAGSGNENHSNLDNSQKSTPTRRNSIRKNTVGSMVNRYESRGGAATQQIMANPHKEQPQPQQRWPQQTYTRKSPPASKSTYTPPTATTTTATTNHTQYKLAPPQGGHDDMSTTAISVLTDEAMEDRNSMIRNVINWERRMQLKRQQSKQQQQNQQHRQQPLQQSKGDCMKRSSEEEEGDIVNLVHEAIAINAGMMTKKSPIRSAKPTRTTANAAAVTTMSSTPKHQSTLKPVVTPEDNQHMTKNDNSTTTNNNVNNPPPPPPPSSSLDEKELPPSPAPTDHSADAAAGMMFALHGKSSTRKKVGSVIKNNEEQESKEEMIRNNESRPSGGTTNTVKVDGRAITSPPPRIISPSSDGVNKPPSSTSTTKTLTSTSTPPRHHHHHNQLNLEQKLGRLATHQTTTPPPRNTNPSSVLSASKVSVVSIQPSIESECVRQNAEILVAMEDAMMDFLGGGGVVGAQAVNGNGDVDEDEGGVTNDDRLNEAFSNSKYVLPEEEEVEGDKIGVRGFNAGGIHNQMVGDTFSTLYSLDERDESDEFADPPLISSDSNSDSNSRRSDASSSRSGSMSDEHNDSGEFIIAKQRKKDKNLGTFLDQLGSLLGVGCALDRDEDSDIFYMNNSQFNTSLVSADVEEMMMNQRRIEGGGVKKAEKDDTRKKRVPALHSSESFCGESHTTMPRGNTAQRRDQLAYLSPTRESGPAFQFARHDISSDDHQPDPDLSLEVDDDDDDNDADDESDCLPDPEEANDADDCGSGRDPPRGIDPDEGEDVFHRNRFQKQNPLNTTSAALTLDNVKMSQREKHKGSSLHWQSSNGLILDDETNAKQLSSIRAKASEKIESTSKLPSTNATLLQEHFVESEHKLSPNYRRRGGGQLQFIDEVEEEDASAPSVEEESEGPQYDYEQFIEDFRDVVQKDSATYEPEPVEELVIGSISETSSLKDEEVDLRINAKHQNVTQRREIEAAVHRSMRQSSYSRQQRNVHHDPKPKLVKPQFEGRQQERHTAQSSDQPGNRAAVTQHSRQAAYGRQYTHPQPVPQPKAATTRLEEKLRGLGAPKKLFGDSVGTSELGSLYSAVGVPKTIYQRTNPPPSKMQNTSNQGPRQRALNIPSRGPTPGLSSQLPLHGRVSPQPGQKTADGFVDSKNTLGFIPIGSETWKLKHEFLDSSPLDPPPRSSPLGFFPTSIDEASQISDGFGSLKNNALGSLKVGAETWNLKYDFNDSPASRNDPFHPPQPQKVESRQHSEPVAPPNVNRFRERTFPSGSPKNDSSNRHPPKKLVMKSITEIRDGTRVQTLRFVGREDSPSPQQPLSPSTGLPSGKKLFQSFPSAVKVARSASSPQSQRVSRVVKKSDQPSQGQMLQTEKRRRNQGAHIGSRQTANNPTPTRPMTNRSLEDNLRRIDPPSSETPTFTEAETSQPHPYQSHPPQRQASGMHHGRSAVHQSSVSYVSTFNGRQAPDQVVAKLDSLRLKGRFKRRK
ncbi:hypothetical protein QTG54_016532 [Skeletonema marinoi]|uniref:Uncharacterized protein n=1 Tax=Skeletonema marinoi TaxID=267567 RepID=A0AAD8XSX3_9STRA|nr:hypothetical protein QTG54_016532 [Skeletonema marinoi]